MVPQDFPIVFNFSLSVVHVKIKSLSISTTLQIPIEFLICLSFFFLVYFDFKKRFKIVLNWLTAV